MRKKIIERRIKKNIKKNSSSRLIKDEKIKSIGILIEHDCMYLSNLLSLLRKEINDVEIKIVSFRKFEKKITIVDNEFTNKDINLKGDFTKQNVVAFLNESFSLLIGYFSTDNIYLKNAVLKSKANFKVGFSSVKTNLFELNIDTQEEQTKIFVIELKKYLKALKKI